MAIGQPKWTFERRRFGLGKCSPRNSRKRVFKCYGDGKGANFLSENLFFANLRASQYLSIFAAFAILLFVRIRLTKLFVSKIKKFETS